MTLDGHQLRHGRLSHCSMPLGLNVQLFLMLLGALRTLHCPPWAAYSWRLLHGRRVAGEPCIEDVLAS